MPSIRPKGSTNNGRASSVAAPMSERQQMALVMQLTSNENECGSCSPSGTNSRSRDRNERGETSLHLAAIKGDVEQVCKLLAHRTDPNVTDFAGWTPLHEACNHGWHEVAVRLIQAGANVNAKGLDNQTPLHDAVVNGHIKVIKLLLERGADVNSKNVKGKTPIDIASNGILPYLMNASLPANESSTNTRLQPRTRDEKKATTEASNKKNPSSEEIMETTSNKSNADDVYEFKSAKETESPPENKSIDVENANNETTDTATPTTQSEESQKRSFSETNDTNEDSGNDDETKRKKRKEETTKESKTSTPQRAGNTIKGQANKQSTITQNKSNLLNTTKTANADRRSPCASPKAAATSDAELDDGKSDLKVPPLKIVIPQSSTNEQDTGPSRNGKNNSQRSHQALPYVVASSNNEVDKETTAGNVSPTDNSKTEEKKETATVNTDEQPSVVSDPESSTSPSVSNSNTAAPAPVDLHPRKRKMKQNKDQIVPQQVHDTPEAPTISEVHPHEQPITNCYQLFLNIRKQIEKRRKGLFPVQPKPPQGFKDYLMNRCTYVLAGTSPTTPNVTFPPTLQVLLKDLFADQEKERYNLRMQHVIEKEKLVLSVEQEILRVHGRAARALANQSLPFSVCTILRDEEVYNLITPEQEEKDRNARSRYNGRLFLSWLQDVDDKWEKIKESMLLRHHNEAESLHAVQKMDWEWKMKELSLCDAKSTPTIDEMHVPMVHVSDDFDLLPA